MPVVRTLGDAAWRYAGELHALAVSHDEHLVVGGGVDLRLWLARDGSLVRRFEAPGEPRIQRLAFSTGDGLLAAATAVELGVWRIADGARVLREVVQTLALAAEGPEGFVAVVQRDDEVVVMRFPGGEVVDRAPGKALSAALAPRTRSWALSRREAPGVIELRAFGEETPRILGGPAEFRYDEDSHDFWGEPCVETHVAEALVRALAFDPAGLRLVTGGSEPVVRLWDAQSGSLVAEVDVGTRDVTSLSFSRGGEEVAVAHGLAFGSRGPARRWCPGEGTLVDEGAGTVAAFVGSLLLRGGHLFRVQDGEGDDDGTSPTGLTLTAGGIAVVRRDSALEAWDLARGQRLWSRRGLFMRPSPVVVGPDGIGWARDISHQEGDETYGLRRVDLQAGPFGERLAPVPVLTYGLAASPDGRWLAVAGYKALVDLWDLEAGVVVGRWRVEGVQALASAPGALWAAAKDGRLYSLPWDRVVVGDIDPGSPLSPRSPAHSRPPNDEAFALAVSDDGAVAVSGWNDVIRVWDLVLGEERAASPPLEKFAKVLAVGFGPDGPFGAVAFQRAEPEGPRAEIRRWSEARGFETVAASPDRLVPYRAVAAALPSGGLLYGGDDGVVKLWEPDLRGPTGDDPR